MNKKDLLPVIILALLIPLWMVIDRNFIAPKFPAKTPPPAERPAEQPPVAEIESFPADTTLSAAQEIAEKPAEPAEEEIIATIENDLIKLELTSYGGGIKRATLKEYPELNEDNSPPVVLDFSDSAALVYEGIPGLTLADALNVKTAEDGQSVTFTKAWESGGVFVRTITATNGYMLDINDRIVNSEAQTLNIPAARILTGRMGNPADMKAMKGLSILGVDTYTPDGGVNYWGRKLNTLYKDAGKPASIDTVPEDMRGIPVDWISTKNKFFTQILSPENPIATMAVLSDRDMGGKGIVPESIAAALVFQPAAVAPNQTLELNYTYFIGPKKYSILKQASSHHMEKVMEFETIGMWSFMNWLMEPSRRALLWTLNVFYGILGNYGVAIILLTLLVRILFWPLTHKSTESMKRMQELQPQIKAIQEKYKNNPQRAQQEVMQFYKENKVNPMGGCIPMFVQIPVFIALYTVLRNAIELRFAGFLWIADLSHPENLLAGKIPFVGSLNILPLVMSVSMIWQQKLTSPGTAATPEQQQQQKMMMFMMPIMMLFFFYSMPSGLVLYWTTSNLLMIAQTAIRNVRKKAKEA